MIFILKMRKYFLLILGVLLVGIGAAQTEIHPKNNQEGLNFTDCIKPEALEILKFSYQNNKEWQVVVGKEIKYKADPRQGSTDWEWQLGEGEPYWTLAPSPNDYRGETKIPINNLPKDNSQFGDNNGLLKVRANIEDATENPQMKEQDIKVFFEKDDISIHDNVPNWFYYWKSLIEDRLEGITVKVYNKNMDVDGDPANGNEGWIPKEIQVNLLYNPDDSELTIDPEKGYSNVLGRANLIDFELERIRLESGVGIVALKSVSANIQVGDLASRACARKYEICDPRGTGCGYGDFDIVDNLEVNTGIHCFLRVIEHELEHVRIFAELWSDYHYIRGPRDYPNNADTDNDRYPDKWEEDKAPERYGFIVGDATDKYGIGEAYVPSFYPNNSDGASAGTNYEETRCRNHEYSVNKAILNDKDWSHTSKPKHERFQGKQW